MKGSIFVLAISLFYVSCRSDNDMHYKDKENKAQKVEVENPVGIQNVNGNIPDTINAVDISNHGETIKPASDNGEQKKNVSGTTPVR